jgi:hypothetical protein
MFPSKKKKTLTYRIPDAGMVTELDQAKNSMLADITSLRSLVIKCPLLPRQSRHFKWKSRDGSRRVLEGYGMFRGGGKQYI